MYSRFSLFPFMPSRNTDVCGLYRFIHHIPSATTNVLFLLQASVNIFGNVFLCFSLFLFYIILECLYMYGPYRFVSPYIPCAAAGVYFIMLKSFMDVF